MTHGITQGCALFAAVLLGYGLGRIGPTDFPAAVEKPSKDFGRSTQPVVQSGRSVQAALVAALAEMDGRQRRRQLEGMALEVGARDPAQALRLLSSIVGIADKQAYLGPLFEQWVLRDRAAALKAAQELPAGELRSLACACATRIWAKSQPNEAAAWAQDSLRGSARQAALQAIAETWALDDPNAAARWAMAKISQRDGSVVLLEVMRIWANSNPTQGADWASSLRGGLRDQAVAALLTEWSDLQPALAAAWLRGHPDLLHLAAVVTGAWSQTDPGAAASWAASLQEPSQRAAAVQQAVASWAAIQPDQALIWATQLNEEGQRLSLTQQVLATWAMDDPPAALAQANGIEIPAQRVAMQQQVFETWAEQFPDQLAAWIAKNPTLQQSDLAREQLSLVWSQAQPEQAMQVAQSIVEAQRRRQSVQNTWSNWQAVNPTSAQHYLRNHPQILPLIQQP